jgi:hypothetical protein
MTTGPLFQQASHALKVRYRMPEAGLTALALLTNADSPKAAARTVLEQCTYETDAERADCLLLLEVCALELQES